MPGPQREEDPTSAVIDVESRGSTILGLSFVPFESLSANTSFAAKAAFQGGREADIDSHLNNDLNYLAAILYIIKLIFS